MPRLLLFGACQKVIVDRDESLISMIAILSGFKVQVPKDEEIPPDALIAVPWGIVTIWLRKPEDEGKNYEQRIEVILPSGQVHGGIVQSFSMTLRTHQVTTKGESFPMGSPGEYLFRLSLRDVGEENEWQIVSDYPVEIQHVEDLSSSGEAAPNPPPQEQ
jgi:hypothetical protein